MPRKVSYDIQSSQPTSNSRRGNLRRIYWRHRSKATDTETSKEPSGIDQTELMSGDCAKNACEDNILAHGCSEKFSVVLTRPE
jgi:hypothetical protein